MQGTRTNRRRGLISLIISVVLLGFLIAIDQITKYSFKALFIKQGATEVIGNFFSLTYTENTGAAWSFLAGVSWAQTFFKILTAASLVLFVLFYFYAFKKDYEWLKIALVFIIAGTIGNFIDRLLLNYVIDFLSFNFWGWDFPVFNFADSCLTVGVIMLIIHYCFIDSDALFRKRKEKEDSEISVSAEKEEIQQDENDDE